MHAQNNMSMQVNPAMFVGHVWSMLQVEPAIAPHTQNVTAQKAIIAFY